MNHYRIEFGNWGGRRHVLYLWRDCLWFIDTRFEPSKRRTQKYFAEATMNMFTGQEFPAGWREVYRTAVPITNAFTGEQKIAYEEELMPYAHADEPEPRPQGEVMTVEPRKPLKARRKGHKHNGPS